VGVAAARRSDEVRDQRVLKLTTPRRFSAGAAVFIALIAGCSADGHDGEALPFEAAGPEAAPDPGVAGPFPVGVVTLDLVYTRGDSDQSRFLRTEVWYPAVQAARGGTVATYDLHDEADEHVSLGDHRESFMAADLGTFVSPAIRGAEPDRERGPYPLVLFSPGAFGLRFQYVFFTAHLASHGFVVAVADHPGTSLWAGIRTGFDETALIAAAFDRTADVRHLLDVLSTAGSTSSGVLDGLIDSGRVGAAGHSLGGAIAVALPNLDTRFSAAVLFAPIIAIGRSFGFEWGDYPVPLMVLGGTEDQTIPWKQQYCDFRAVDVAPKWLVEISGIGHFTFSDACGFDWTSLDAVTPGQTPDIVSDGCSEAMTPSWNTAHQLIRRHATAFLNHHLRAAPSALAQIGATGPPASDAVRVLLDDAVPDWPDGGCP
jgi:predicted dienelactone hydrolase